MKKVLALPLLLLGLSAGSAAEPLKETLAPLGGEQKVPQNFEELWKGFDPRAEPLDVEVLHGWEEDGVVMRVLRYRAGIFKGEKAMIAGIFGYPRGAKGLPGLVQIHGGGQYADANAVLTNAKRGYATISISWAGRISAPDYLVNPDGVRLFWEGKKDDPNYRVTTDWGALDGYHAPSRNSGNSFSGVKPGAWTLDAVDSPRNNPWFLCTLAARRAITFLEQQPQVDLHKIGVYGHSMGGKLTVMTTAADSRVKAAAPSCGGISDLVSDHPLYAKTICDQIQHPHLDCPIIFLSPANDFHGRIGDLEKAVTGSQAREWRVTCSPHHNHQDTPPFEVATQLWFDQHLKGEFTWPKTPKLSVALNGEVSVFVEPDRSREILGIDVFYTQQGKMNESRKDIENAKHRFWHHATTEAKNGAVVARLPLNDTRRPVWVYANVRYALERPVSGAGYYYRTYTANDFNLSSLMRVITPEQLEAGKVRSSDPASLLIEDFEGDWKKEWFSYRPESEWAITTNKLYDPKWRGVDGAQLAFRVKSNQPNKLVVRVDDYIAEVVLKGGGWQEVILGEKDFEGGEGKDGLKWSEAKSLKLGAKEVLKNRDRKKNRTFGGAWSGRAPEFENLRWMIK